MAQQLVQSCHASLEAGFEFIRPNDISFLVLLQVKDIDELQNISEELNYHNIKFKMFYEPDIHNDKILGYSSICTEPIFNKHKRKIFNKYNLWTQ